VTGFTNTMSSLGGKQLELLREAVPSMSEVGLKTKVIEATPQVEVKPALPGLSDRRYRRF